MARSGSPSPAAPTMLWPRHRLDISWTDLIYALGACAAARGPREDRVLRAWGAGDQGIVCLSVRSGFDLLLGALSLPADGEVVMSAVTHPDMVRLVEAHGLRAVPVDLDPDTLAPREELLRQAITPETRAIVVAHLFGGRIDLEPVARVTRERGLLLVEDCAQSFRGPEHTGDPLADVSLFSFGPIKTATALGGAIVRVRDRELRDRMLAIQAGWPVQPRRTYARRVVKFAPLLVLRRPRAYGLFARAVAGLGWRLDGVVSEAVRGFPGPELAVRIRRRPSSPLLAVLERRLRRFDHQRLERRAQLGEQTATRLAARHVVPGLAALDRTHWVVPIIARDPGRTVAVLRSQGFDAASGTSGIATVEPSIDRPGPPVDAASSLLRGIVFLPAYPELGERELARLCAALHQADGSS